MACAPAWSAIVLNFQKKIGKKITQHSIKTRRARGGKRFSVMISHAPDLLLLLLGETGGAAFSLVAASGTNSLEVKCERHGAMSIKQVRTHASVIRSVFFYFLDF